MKPQTPFPLDSTPSNAAGKVEGAENTPHTLQSLLTLAETEEGRHEIRVMVAEMRGWRMIKGESPSSAGHFIAHLGSTTGFVPPYHTSLDAIMPEVRKLDEQGRNRWINHMADIIDPMGELEWRADFAIATAQPIYHCIALLLSLQNPNA